MRSTSRVRTVRRVIAVTLTLLFTLTLTGGAFAAMAADTGGDFGVCDNGLWQKADWNKTTQTWDWEDGPGWDDDAPATPVLTVTSYDDGDPMTVDWTSSTYVEKVSVKAATLFETFEGGYSGTVTGIDKYAISHIVFCYGPEPPPAPTGSLTVAKDVVGDYEGDDFDFAGTCQLPQFPAHAQFSLADGESWTFPERIPGYLDGSPCEFEEVVTNGADSVTYRLGETELVPDADGKVHFTLSSTEDLVLTVTNTFVTETPTVVLEKAWFAEADDTAPTAIFRQDGDGWMRVDDGAPFTQPEGFDLTVTYGEQTYTVAETLPEGWQTITCPPDAPQPNGIGTFPYSQPNGNEVGTSQVEGPDGIRHVVCNAPVPVPPPVTPVPSIELVKTADPGLVTYDPDGDPQSVTYTYTVTNTGQTTLTAITLVDDVLGTITLADTSLAVGESTTGTATHQVTTADADAGQIVNIAEVTGTAPGQTKVTDTDTATVVVETIEVLPEVEAKPEITLTKTALVEPDDDGRKVVVFSASAPTDTEITYQYVIANTGETTLTGITLVDDVLGTITLTDTDLAVGESMTVTAVHTVTEADADTGTITNVATATGTDPDGTEVDATAQETVLVGEVKAEAIQPEVKAEVVEQDELPVTGAPAAALAVLASLSLATGTGLLRASRRKE